MAGLLLFPKGEQGGDGNVALPYACMGVVVLLVAVVFSRVRLPEIREAAEAPTGAAAGHGLWSHASFRFGLLALFAYEVAEISINSFFINYVVEQQWMDPRRAALSLSFGGLTLFMCGRFAGSWVMSRVRAERVLFVCLFLEETHQIEDFCLLVARFCHSALPVRCGTYPPFS